MSLNMEETTLANPDANYEIMLALEMIILVTFLC